MGKLDEIQDSLLRMGVRWVPRHRDDVETILALIACVRAADAWVGHWDLDVRMNGDWWAELHQKKQAYYAARAALGLES